MVKRDESTYLSDDSDFYGDEAAKQELEIRANSFSAKHWWTHKIPSLTEVGDSNMTPRSKAGTLYNPYQGRRCGRQLEETVEDFLRRLPPATTVVSYDIPWIFIANPYRKAPSRALGEYSQEELIAEGPPEEESDTAQFIERGRNLLEELSGIRNDTEKKKAGQAKATITKAVSLEKDLIIRKILDAAVELHCTSGKWMMFCQAAEVNAVWSVIAHATERNELGTAAKVAPDQGDPRRDRLICIYTKDFTNMDDVSRVIRKMRDLGLVETRGKPLYYKCDAYTYLGLNSNNEYSIKASLYSSADILKLNREGSKDQKLEGFFYEPKKDLEDWRQMEWE